MEFCINILLIHRWAAHILFLKGKQKGYHSLYSYSYKCRAVAWKLLQQSARRLPVVITKKCDKRWVTRKKGGNEETGRTGAICFTQVIANSEDICAVGGWLVVVGGSEDNTGNEDKPSNQKEGHKIQNHQEAKEHEVRLDTTSKVPCEGEETWFVSNVNLTRGGLSCFLYCPFILIYCMCTSNHLHWLPPQWEKVKKFFAFVSEFTQHLSPSPGHISGKCGRPHLLHFPVKDK